MRYADKTCLTCKYQMNFISSIFTHLNSNSVPKNYFFFLGEDNSQEFAFIYDCVSLYEMCCLIGYIYIWQQYNTCSQKYAQED